MARQRKGRPQLPETLLDDVMWTFHGEPFSDQAAFAEAVREENGAVRKANDPEFSTQWLQQPFLFLPRIRITPDSWDWDQEDPVLELTPDNGVAFTPGELLFKVHNAWVTVLRELDHKYFEGFTLAEKQERGKPPLYELDLGS
jgi:hypothetical protein